MPAKVQTHVAECERCQAELAELKATMDLLDEWEAPEPSPYFLTRLNARMREEREAAPAGLAGEQNCAAARRFAYGRVRMRGRLRRWRSRCCCLSAGARTWG